MIRKITIIAVIILLVGAIVFKLAQNKKEIDQKNALAPITNLAIPVNVYTVAAGHFNDSLVKVGTLIPFKEADINALVSGKLTSVNFNLGTMVSQGTVIANIDNKSSQLNLQLAEQNRAQAERDVKRNDALYAGNATTLKDVQTTQLNYDNSVNQIDLLQKQISDSRIKAPVSGQITAKLKEAGEYVMAGNAIGHIVDLSRLKVDVMVGEGDVYTLRQGQAVVVTTDVYPHKTFEGHITFISNKGDATHNYQVEITMPNPAGSPLKAGTFAYVNFNRKSSSSAILIPRSALLEGLQTPKVYVVENGRAVARAIVTGGEIGDLIAVKSGLSSGDQVITNGQINLRENTLVKAILSDSTAL